MIEKKSVDRKNIIMNRKNHGQALTDLEQIKELLKAKQGYAPNATIIVCMALKVYKQSLILGIKFEEVR